MTASAWAASADRAVAESREKRTDWVNARRDKGEESEEVSVLCGCDGRAVIERGAEDRAVEGRRYLKANGDTKRDGAPAEISGDGVTKAALARRVGRRISMVKVRTMVTAASGGRATMSCR